LSWEQKPNIKNFDIGVHDIRDRKRQVIKQYASQIALNVNWKSSATANHLGYNAYQNIRLSLTKIMEEQEKNLKESYDTINFHDQQLNEGYITEVAFWDKIKDAISGFVKKAKGLWDRFIIFVKNVLKFIQQTAKQGIKALSNILGFEFTIQDTLRNNKKLRIR